MGEPHHVRAGLAAVVVGLLGGLMGCATPAVKAVGAGPLPAAQIEDLSGRPHEVRALAGNRPTIVSLWATWCESCAEEFAPLNRLYDRTKSDGHIVAIAVGESAEQVAPFAAKKGLRYPIYVDPEFQLATALGSRSVPTTIILDRAGRIVYRGAIFDAAALAVYRELIERP